MVSCDWPVRSRAILSPNSPSPTDATPFQSRLFAQPRCLCLATQVPGPATAALLSSCSQKRWQRESMLVAGGPVHPRGPPRKRAREIRLFGSICPQTPWLRFCWDGPMSVLVWLGAMRTGAQCLCGEFIHCDSIPGRLLVLRAVLSARCKSRSLARHSRTTLAIRCLASFLVASTACTASSEGGIFLSLWYFSTLSFKAGVVVVLLFLGGKNQREECT